MIELARTQDEEVGDGTTSVIILGALACPQAQSLTTGPNLTLLRPAGEMLHLAEPFLEQNLHPTVVVRGYVKALEDALAVIDRLAFPIDTNDPQAMLNIVNSCIGTKYTSRFGPLMAQLALEAVQCVAVDRGDGTKEIDVKKYAKVEKIPGGSIDDCTVLRGVMFNKDVVAPARMRRRIQNPRILLLDCPLEYKKGENQTNVEICKEEDFATLLKIEEEWIENTCAQIIALKPDVVITEKARASASRCTACAHILALRRGLLTWPPFTWARLESPPSAASARRTTTGAFPICAAPLSASVCAPLTRRHPPALHAPRARRL